MALRLPPSKLYLIRDMIEGQFLTISQMAEKAECSKLTIINIRENLRLFGSDHAPPTRMPETNHYTLNDRGVLRPAV